MRMTRWMTVVCAAAVVTGCTTDSNVAPDADIVVSGKVLLEDGQPVANTGSWSSQEVELNHPTALSHVPVRLTPPRPFSPKVEMNPLRAGACPGWGSSRHSGVKTCWPHS